MVDVRNIDVRIGPVPAPAARAYLTYARDILDAIDGGRVAGVVVEPALAVSFRRYLDEWLPGTSGSGSFAWRGVVDRDELAEVASGWLDLMSRLSGRFEALGLPVGPADGEAFYHHLVDAIGAALEADVDLPGDKLREVWPALGTLDRRHAEPFEKQRVVIVDDSADLRMVLRLALEQDGRFEVVGEAGDGAAALAVCEETSPDLVLLDIVMPRVDGWMALEDLRVRCPESRVVMVSSFDEASAAGRALAAGAVGYLQKSISLASMSDTLFRLAS